MKNPPKPRIPQMAILARMRAGKVRACTMAAPSQKRATNVQAYGADTTGMWTNLGVVECRKYKLVRLKKLTIRRSSATQKSPRTQSMMKPKTRRLF
jgi:hypothetical protein